MKTSRTGRPAERERSAGAPRSADEGPSLRVVILAGRAGADLAASADSVRVASPYEAAAEILAAPTTALVVDLRLVVGRHLRLLEIARQMEVEVLAVGSVPAGLTNEDLSGVRLVSRVDLPAALARLEKTPAPVSAENPSPPAPTPEAPEEPEAEVMGPIPPEALRAEAMRNRQAADANAESPSRLLSKEELAALLEREP